MNENIHDTLARAVTHRSPVHLISLRTEGRILGRLAEMGEDAILVDVESGYSPHPPDLVSASFAHGPRLYTFLSHVVDGAGEGLWLSFPRGIVSADRRLTPRAPVTAPVEVSIHGVHPHSAPLLADIALTGMRVRIAAPTGLRPLQRTQVDLRLGEHHVELTAELRHETENAAGFFFPETVRRGRLSPPAALEALVERVREG